MFSSRRALYLFAGLLAVFCASRGFTVLAAGSLWFDEAFSAHIASLPWSQARELLAYEHNPWLHFLVLKMAMIIGGDTDWVLRLPSVFAGAGSLVAMYWLAKKMFTSDKTALASAGLLTISTLHLYHQTEARMYAFVTLFTVLALGLAYVQPKRWMLYYTLIAILLAHTHLTAWLILLAVYGVVWLELRHEKRDTKFWHIAHAGILATGLIWLIPVAMHRFGLSGTSQGWFFAQHEAGYFLTHLTNYIINGEARLPLRAIAAFLASGCLFSALFTVEKPMWWQQIKHVFDRDQWPLNIALNWTRPIRFLVLTIAIVALAGFALQMTVTKYLIAASVPLLLLMGYGLARMPKAMSIGVFVALTLIALPTHARLLQSRHHWDVAAKQVAALQAAHDNQITLVHSFAYAMPLQRYLPTDAAIVPVYPLNDEQSFDQAVVRHNWQPIINDENIVWLDEQLAGHTTVILVSSTNGKSEQDPVKAYLWQNGWKLVEQYHYDGYGDPEILVWTM